jgi:hypothetical protein
VAKAAQNLFQQSQALATNPWGQLRVTRTNNADTAPDGTTTATRVTQASGQTTMGLTGQTVNFAANSTVSVFAKPDGKNFIVIQTTSSPVRRTWFDVQNGTVGTTFVDHTASIVDAGNGWYRCIVVSSVAGGDGLSFYLADADNSSTVVDSGSVLFWGAQLEQRSAVTAYTPTTTQPITNYIPVLETAAAGVARFDHNPVTGESLGLLIEEQRTNLLLRSEEFSTSPWVNLDSAITANTVIAPDGTLTADKLVDTTTNVLHYVVQVGAVVSSNANYAYSVYVKAGEYSRVRIRYGRSGTPFTRIGIIVNLSDGTFTNADVGTPTSVAVRSATPVGNGWYRIVVAGIFDTTGTIAHTEVALVNDAGNVTFAGDGYSGLYIWGAQLEAGAFPTSYIPTVASQVTRSRDEAIMTGANFSSWYNQMEGSFYAEGSAATGSGRFPALAVISEGAATNNSLTFGYLTASVGGFEVRSGNALQVNVFPSVTTFVRKAAFGFAVDNFAVSYNGANVSTDTSGQMPVVDRLTIGAAATLSAASTVSGHIRKVAYYPKRLADDQLQGITTV